MNAFFDHKGQYYETPGPAISLGDISVPQRPDSTFDWDGTVWKKNPAALAEEQLNVANQLALSTVLADPTVQFLLNHDPQTCYAQVQTMVVDLATAKDMLGRFGMVLCVVVRELAGTVDHGA